MFADRVVWQGRHHPDMTFVKGEWLLRTTPPPRPDFGFGVVSLVNKVDPTRHQELRIPHPDMDLISAVLSARY